MKLEDGTFAVGHDESDMKLMPEGVKCFDGVPSITKDEKLISDAGKPELSAQSITASKASVQEVTADAIAPK